MLHRLVSDDIATNDNNDNNNNNNNNNNDVNVDDVAGTIALEQFSRAIRNCDGALPVRSRVAGFLRFTKSFGE
jgi:hypothetical protein